MQLSPYELKEATRMLTDGITPSKVARKLGVSIKAVYRLAEEVAA